MEFQGPDLDEFSMDVKLSAEYGVAPAEIIKDIQEHIWKGLAENLVIGGKAVGKNPYVIKEMSEAWDEIWNEGQLFRATISLTFREYIRNAKKSSKKSKKKGSGKKGSGSGGGKKGSAKK
jgi:hypothetical protein